MKKIIHIVYNYILHEYTLIIYVPVYHILVSYVPFKRFSFEKWKNFGTCKVKGKGSSDY